MVLNYSTIHGAVSRTDRCGADWKPSGQRERRSIRFVKVHAFQARWIVAPYRTGGALTELQRTSFRRSEESMCVQPANSFLAIHRASLARCGPSTSDPATAPSNSTMRARAIAFGSFTPAAVVHSRKRSANHSR